MVACVRKIYGSTAVSLGLQLLGTEICAVLTFFRDYRNLLVLFGGVVGDIFVHGSSMIQIHDPCAESLDVTPPPAILLH